ncbi:MAG: hypothetical protein EOP89_00430 [Lysobacteraceae bacterium]|nr:MAG: hypothetical protein EOP89_00430 [Xanthomonadaceae bacterium]
MSNDTEDSAGKAKVSVAEAILKISGAAVPEAGTDGAATTAGTVKSQPTISRARRAGTIHLKH